MVVETLHATSLRTTKNTKAAFLKREAAFFVAIYKFSILKFARHPVRFEINVF
jgi:hypothetical protein